MIDASLISFVPVPLLNNLDPFLQSYIEAGLGGLPNSHSLSPADVHQSAMSRFIEDCRQFRTQAEWSIENGMWEDSWSRGWTPHTRAGWEFWMARNGLQFSRQFWHADTAFFLTRVAKSFGRARLYIGQWDGLVYQAGAEDF